MKFKPFAACALVIALPVFTRAETKSRLHASGEVIYWQPVGLDFPVVQPLNSAGQNTGTPQGIEYGFTPGYRMTIQWDNLRINWIDLQTQENYTAPCSNCGFYAVQRGAVGGSLSGALTAVSAVSATRLQILDFDLLKSVTLGSEPSFITSWGFRYARIYNNTDMHFQKAGFGAVDLRSRVVNNMIGVRAGLEGSYQIRSRFRLAGSAALSLLHGTSHGDEAEITPVAQSRTATTYKTIAPALEAGLKLACTPAKDFDIWLGYDLLRFSEGLIRQTSVGAAGSGVPVLETRQNVAFMGPNVGLRWHFF